ncbi:MAG TPA: MarR family transcriptional regulator [Acidimicrobiales bacterium]|nr:MarR family transcriptional regulator [Acidimicrobiales bacterium]
MPSSPNSPATRSGQVDDLARELYAGVVLCMRRIKQVYGDMSFTERAVLSRLDRNGPATAAELARAERVTAQAIGVTVAGMEERGLIDRRPDPGDRRRVILSISDMARRDLGQMRDARANRLAQVLEESFDAGELTVLAAAAPLIEKLGEHL